MIILSSNQKTPATVIEHLFPNDCSKTNAFEIIANQYYFTNSGTTSKTEIDLLLFSIFFEKLEEAYRENPEQHSDYEISHLLGISQNRVRTLKEQYELKYSAGYDSREEFWKICEKAE